ncbi:MAG: hypothetical protein PHU46_13130 [Rhodocyclaceae bacterium]|nr:hypothetical protein [Rhodocyclaceae bacterium]
MKALAFNLDRSCASLSLGAPRPDSLVFALSLVLFLVSLLLAPVP